MNRKAIGASIIILLSAITISMISGFNIVLVTDENDDKMLDVAMPGNYSVFWLNNYTILCFRVKYGEVKLGEHNIETEVITKILDRIALRIKNETGLIPYGTRNATGYLTGYNFDWGIIGKPDNIRGIKTIWINLQIYVEGYHDNSGRIGVKREVIDQQFIDTILRIMFEEI